jgi:rsbT co-antagonist protein RsbR
MSLTTASVIPSLLATHQAALLDAWSAEQLRRIKHAGLKELQLRTQCAEFLRTLTDATAQGNCTELRSAEWSEVREMLAEVSRSRASIGLSPSETALFVFSLKKPLFDLLRRNLAGNAEALAEETWNATVLLDDLGLYTIEMFMKTREAIIMRQQQELLELSTPVIKLWDGVLAVPLIGTLDSNRTQVVMENLLEEIVRSGSEIAIIDITGVPTVDTLVAQHLMKTIAATRLMGAECIISGIRPQIAQTIVQLGVELGDIVTKATLKDAFALALRRTGLSVVQRQPAA